MTSSLLCFLGVLLFKSSLAERAGWRVDVKPLADHRRRPRSILDRLDPRRISSAHGWRMESPRIQRISASESPDLAPQQAMSAVGCPL